MNYLCGLGTSLQTKMMAAITLCSPPEVNTTTQTMDAGRADLHLEYEYEDMEEALDRRFRWRSCNQSCPSMDKIKASITKKMSEELCILQSIGWIDAEGNHVKVCMACNKDDLSQDVVYGL